MATPKIILKVRFNTYQPSDKLGDDYGSYAVDYMGRKKALNEKEFLTQKEQKQLNYINSKLDDIDQKLIVSDSFNPRYKSESKLDKANEQDLYKKSLAEMNADDFARYQDYMTRKNAIEAHSDLRLSKSEKEELKKYDQFFNKFDLPTSEDDGVLPGYFTSDQDIVRNADKSAIRKKMRECAMNGSVMWTNVISFDNEFLKEMNVYDPTSGYLDEAGMRKAAHRMMDVMTQKEGLNHPFWTAAIHRNTDNIHIHFAVAEAANSRPLQNYKGKEEPRGKFKQSTLNSMKSAFANTMFQTTDLLKEMNATRNKLTKNIKEAFEESLDNSSFQNQLNKFVKNLPPDRKNWRWANLNKDQKEQLNHLVNRIINDDPEYGKMSSLFSKYESYYNNLYGYSKNSNKNTAFKKWQDYRKRMGNSLLTELRTMDRRAEYFRSKLPNNKNIDPNNYVQECLNVLSNSKKQKHHHHLAISPIIQKKYKQRHDEWKRIQLKQKKNKSDYELKKKLRPIFKKENTSRLYSRMQKIFQKEMTSKDKQEALLEYERLHNTIPGERQQLE